MNQASHEALPAYAPLATWRAEPGSIRWVVFTDDPSIGPCFMFEDAPTGRRVLIHDTAAEAVDEAFEITSDFRDRLKDEPHLADEMAAEISTISIRRVILVGTEAFHLEYEEFPRDLEEGEFITA
jgi:hypothetical protein